MRIRCRAFPKEMNNTCQAELKGSYVIQWWYGIYISYIRYVVCGWVCMSHSAVCLLVCWFSATATMKVVVLFCWLGPHVYLHTGSIITAVGTTLWQIGQVNFHWYDSMFSCCSSAICLDLLWKHNHPQDWNCMPEESRGKLDRLLNNLPLSMSFNINIYIYTHTRCTLVLLVVGSSFGTSGPSFCKLQLVNTCSKTRPMGLGIRFMCRNHAFQTLST